MPTILNRVYAFLAILSFVSSAPAPFSISISTYTDSTPHSVGHASASNFQLTDTKNEPFACGWKSSPVEVECAGGWYPFFYEKARKTVWTCCTDNDPEASSSKSKKIALFNGREKTGFSFLHLNYLNDKSISEYQGSKYPIGFCFKLNMPSQVPCGDGWIPANKGDEEKPLWTCCKMSEPSTTHATLETLQTSEESFINIHMTSKTRLEIGKVSIEVEGACLEFCGWTVRGCTVGWIFGPGSGDNNCWSCCLEYEETVIEKVKGNKQSAKEDIFEAEWDELL